MLRYCDKYSKYSFGNEKEQKKLKIEQEKISLTSWSTDYFVENWKHGH